MAPAKNAPMRGSTSEGDMRGKVSCFGLKQTTSVNVRIKRLPLCSRVDSFECNCLKGKYWGLCSNGTENGYKHVNTLGVQPTFVNVG